MKVGRFYPCPPSAALPIPRDGFGEVAPFARRSGISPEPRAGLVMALAPLPRSFMRIPRAGTAFMMHSALFLQTSRPVQHDCDGIGQRVTGLRVHQEARPVTARDLTPA